MAITCKAAISDGHGGFILDDIEVLSPQKDEVLVRIRAAGLCHTDHDSLYWGKPLILGHEGAGVVVQVGEQVKGFRPNDLVILNWATPCGFCFQCVQGNQNICENNSPVVAGGNGYTPGHACLAGTTWKKQPILRSFNLGTLSEYTLVKASALVKNHSSKISFAAASIISCGVMTGYGSAVNVARVKAGSSVVVIGAGGVGLSVIQGARICGASRIIAIDVIESRLKMAIQFGATDVMLADKTDKVLQAAAGQVNILLGGRGADYAFECTAVAELGATPLAMIRNGGTAVQVSGIEQEIMIDMRLFEWDKLYINPLYGKCRPQIDFPVLINHYDNGQLMLDEMITRTYSLAQLREAFDDMLEGKNAKGVIVF